MQLFICFYLFNLLTERSVGRVERERTRQNCLLMFTFVSSMWTSPRANGQVWCFKAAWERESGTEWLNASRSNPLMKAACCVFCMHFCVVFHLWFVPVYFLCVITSICNGCTLCFHYYLTLLISKASFSALGRVQLPQDCQIRLSLVASPPLSFTPLVHINAWGLPLFDDKQNYDSFGP